MPNPQDKRIEDCELFLEKEFDLWLQKLDDTPSMGRICEWFLEKLSLQKDSIVGICEELLKKVHSKNPTHDPDEYWGCIECYEDKIKVRALQDLLNKIKEI